MREQIDAVSDFFGEPYDDREDRREDQPSLRVTAEHFRLSILKTRKILITAGKYSVAQSRLVQKLYGEGKTVPEIMALTELSRASVHSYLPYEKTVYNMKERSVGADRIARWRKRHREQKE